MRSTMAWAACRLSVPALNFSAAASRRVGRSSFRTSLGCLASPFFFHVSLAFLWWEGYSRRNSAQVVSLFLHKVPIEDPTTAEPGIALGPKALLLFFSVDIFRTASVATVKCVCTTPTKVEVPRWTSSAVCNSVLRIGMHLSVCQSVWQRVLARRTPYPTCPPSALHATRGSRQVCLLKPNSQILSHHVLPPNLAFESLFQRA